MPPTTVQKRPTPTASTTPAVDPLATVTARMEADNARLKLAHLQTYRAAVFALATGATIAAEEEQPLADALAYFDLDTGALSRDVHAAKSIEAMKNTLGATPEERAAKDSKLWNAVKESANNLDKLRDELKQAEQRHHQLNGASNGYGIACGEIDRLTNINPRIFAASWPPPPKPVTPEYLPANAIPMAPVEPRPAPPSEYTVHHPLLGRDVTVSAEVYEKMRAPTPSQNGTLQEQAAFDKRLAERRAALDQKLPVAFFDASKVDE